MTRFEVLVLTTLLALICRPGEAAKSAESIACTTLPGAVRAAAAREKAKAGTTPVCEKILENGRTLFEVKITTPAGKMREMVNQPGGKLEEWEEETDLKSIPAGARAAIERAPGLGVLHKVDIIRRGSLTLYEGEYRKGPEKKKLVVDADGRAVTP
jgi:hypothetical protein